MCRDQILEVEEKLYLGTLGSLEVEDRQAWQTALQTRDYSMGCEELTWGGDGETRRLTPDMLMVSWNSGILSWNGWHPLFALDAIV